MVRFLHVNSSEIRCVMPMTDVFEHVLGSAVVAVYTTFITYQRADSISNKGCFAMSPVQSNQAKTNHFKARIYGRQKFLIHSPLKEKE